MLTVHRAAVRGTAARWYEADVIEAWAPHALQAARIEELSRRIESGEERAVVARDASGAIIGFGSIAPDARELRAVYVAPDHGRAGVGGAILRELEVQARRHGLVELAMDASLNAEAFYRRHGFASVGRGEHVLRGGQRMACIRMHKLLE
jgi:putative acetyltransferase